ncbi:hypothetical protein U9M48_030814 [Paspalum notatum var. saurae]|uniref:Plant bHLH transcription factor ACT-like domain-containing protein n=1 Tax=Paspalum notatum var. saurae TaxID=547442 RepID=A0AAQ3U1M2_PASNO
MGSQADKTSILEDASKYIKELKDKVQEAAAASQADSTTSCGSAMAATVSVSSVDVLDSSSRRFRINVSMERGRPGLLVSVLEAFEDLGLNVLNAYVSCADAAAFRLQALGSCHQGQRQGEVIVDDQVVCQAVLQAITK